MRVLLLFRRCFIVWLKWEEILAILQSKVYLAKVYDSIKWSFIHNVLTQIGLPPTMVNFIMNCVTLVQMNVLWVVLDLISSCQNVVFIKGTQCLLVCSLYELMKAGREGPYISYLMFAEEIIDFGLAYYIVSVAHSYYTDV